MKVNAYPGCVYDCCPYTLCLTLFCVLAFGNKFPHKLLLFSLLSKLTVQESCSGEGIVRLTKSRSSNDTVGRLEVCASGLWGTVCKKEATNTLVKVVCRQLSHAADGK